MKKPINENELNLKEVLDYVIRYHKEAEWFDWTYYISRTILYRWLPKELGWWSFANATRIFDRLAKEGYIDKPNEYLGKHRLINI